MLIISFGISGQCLYFGGVWSPSS